MKVEIFNLCDYASVDAGGKLNMLGVFNTIYPQQSPIIYGPSTLAIRIRFEPTEEGPKKIKVAFVNADGRAVLPTADVQIQVQLPANAPCAIAQVCLMIPQIALPKLGEYSVDLAIDGTQVASTPLYVQQFPAAGQPNFPTPPQQDFPTPPSRA